MADLFKVKKTASKVCCKCGRRFYGVDEVVHFSGGKDHVISRDDLKLLDLEDYCATCLLFILPTLFHPE